MLEQKQQVQIARVSKTFGLHGELIIQLFDTFPQDFNLSEPLFVTWDELAVPLFFDRFEKQGKNKAVVIFSDIQTERRATELIGKTLWLNASSESNALAEDEEDDNLYFEDLVGYTAQLRSGLVSRSGVIENFIDGENPLFYLSVKEQEVFIPAVEEFIADIDTEKRHIEFELPEGLLDLYL